MEDKWGLFQKFLILEDSQISLEDFLVNAIIVIILSFVLERTYIKCAKSLSNRKLFSANFMIIAFTTMLIINIVKSSLALSLGLVGALSIVRFRSAIKEPEELAYLFLTISIGLGLGAGPEQRIVVLLAFSLVLLVIWLRYFFLRKNQHQNLILTVSSNEPEKLKLKHIMAIVESNFSAAELKRFDENDQIIEVSFLIEAKKATSLESCKTALSEISEKVRVSFLDNKSY